MVTATYDARGNIRTQTEVNPYGTGDATTRYEYTNAAWPDFVTRIVPPEKDSTVMDYHANGNRAWHQPGADQARRVEFFYNGLGLYSSMRMPSQRASGGHETPWSTTPGATCTGPGRPKGTGPRPRRTCWAGTRSSPPRSTRWGNPSRRRPSRTTRWTASGRSNRSGPHSAIHAPIRTASPKRTPAEERLFVRNFYNAEGALDSVARWSRPDTSRIGTITTRWRYDAAGRKIREVAPDRQEDEYTYDLAGNVKSWRTRRGHTISMEYDALSRLKTRVVPGASYDVWKPQWMFPYYVDDGTGGLNQTNGGFSGLTIPGDVASFTYDAVGNLLSATNRDATVKRSYYPNGSLATDTLKVRTYAELSAGGDTTRHVYGLGYGYDLNGRRKTLVHPKGLAPVVDGVIRDVQRYAYNDTTGALKTVTDVLDNSFQYAYTADGELERLSGAGTEIHYSYDADGQMMRRVDRAGTYLLHEDTLFHDARGKTLRARTNTDTIAYAYTGLGSLAWSYTHPYVSVRDKVDPEEAYVTDALGNAHTVTRRSTDPVRDIDDGWYASELRYEPGTGRLLKRWTAPHVSTNPLTQTDTTEYDAAGNRFRYANAELAWTPYKDCSGTTCVNPSDATLREWSASYYGADERLRVMDRRTCYFYPEGGCDRSRPPLYGSRPAFEEHRYDALGRRVLVRTRQEWACGSHCDNSLRRIVWDGDQILYEISAPGATSATEAEMERDVGHVVPYKSESFLYGRIAYTHGSGIDQPLALIRMEYSDLIPGPELVVPRATWRGTYDTGTFGSFGAGSRCEGVWEQVSKDELNPDSAFVDYCIEVDWPAPHLWSSQLSRRRNMLGPVSWMGSLIVGGRDASGQLYRRNRFYDPQSGRFTQEDPIGLAGGLNVYGFANGDPVSYSDPYGLKVICMNRAACQLWSNLLNTARMASRLFGTATSPPPADSSSA